MAKYFSDQRIAELNGWRTEVRPQFRALREQLMLHQYQTERGAEFAKHGFCRRLGTLVRSIDQVYELLPPDREDIPSRDVVMDATTAIQGFVMNAFGCLENIAWVLVHEKPIKNSDGTELEPLEIGLGKRKVRPKLSDDFNALLDKRQEWLGNLIDFRDSLAHRIPLYIPPYAVPEGSAAKYKELDAAKWKEPALTDPAEYQKVVDEQLKLCQFVPGMMHSIFDKSPQVEFHSQLLSDYVTIDEYGWQLVEELNS